MKNPVDSFDNAVAAETPNISETLTSLASAQRADPALKNLFQWVTRGTPPSTHELQRTVTRNMAIGQRIPKSEDHQRRSM